MTHVLPRPPLDRQIARRLSWSLWKTAILLPLLACNSTPGPRAAPPPRARPDQIPPTVAIPAINYAFGFALGRGSDPVSVTAFAITKTPITVGQYRECVAAKFCSTTMLTTSSCQTARSPIVEGPTYDATGATDGLPLTCVNPVDAATYCSWVGGTLPTIEQWVYAARGSQVQEFAWGAARPDCAKHQRAMPGAGCCTQNKCDPSTYFSAGQLPDVASSTGVLDILLTPGELVRNHSGAALGACSAASGACAVRGILPGAIDGAVGVSFDNDPNNYKDPAFVSGFRCTFEVKS